MGWKEELLHEAEAEYEAHKEDCEQYQNDEECAECDSLLSMVNGYYGDE